MGGCEIGCIIGITTSLLALLLISGIIVISSSISRHRSNNPLNSKPVTLTDNPAYGSAVSQRYEGVEFAPQDGYTVGVLTAGCESEDDCHYDYIM